MEAVKTRPSDASQELGDETFMSANDLRTYMADMEMARASKEIERLLADIKSRKSLPA